MRLIKCRKCGATIATDETFIQRMMDDINILSEKARKDKKNASSYLQQAAAIRKIMQQYLHRTANMDERRRELQSKLSILWNYVHDNKLIGEGKLNELMDKGEEIARQRIAEEEAIVNELYRGFENISINRTKADPTAKQGERKTK
jgi:hypothetical protein